MEKQVIDFGAVVRGIVTYAASNETIERATQARFESRKIVADFVRAAHGMEWKKIQKPIKSAIESLAIGIVSDKNGLLGVIKTCCEYGIMPTTLNADRLRKAKTWTDLNGKVIPNGYGKVHTKEGAGKKLAASNIQTDSVPLNALALATMQPGANVPAAPVQTVSAPISQKIEAMQANVDAVFGTARPTTQTQTITQPQTPPKVPSTKPVTPQKTETKVVPLHANISGDSEAPISSREHCALLLDQLFKNDAFRGEFAPILAMCLDSNVATVTRCLVEARDAMLNGKGVK